MREWCWNNRQPTPEGYWVVVRDYKPNGQYTYKQQFIPNRMSESCGQPGKDLPPAVGCVGCKDLQAS